MPANIFSLAIVVKAFHIAFDVFIKTISLAFQQKKPRFKRTKTRFKRKGYIHVNKCNRRISNVLFIVVTIASAYGKSAVMSVCLHSHIRYARSQFLSILNAVFCFKTLETWSTQCAYTQWMIDWDDFSKNFANGEGECRSELTQISFRPSKCLRCAAIKIAFWLPLAKDLSSFSTDSSSQLDVFGHDGDPLGMDGAQIGVFEETNQVSFRGFLQGSDSSRLESKVSLEILSNFSHQSLEWELSDQQLSGFLVSSDLTKSDGTRSVTMGFLDSSSGWGALASCLCGQLFSWGFASSRFSCGLLGSCHLEVEIRNEIRQLKYV